MRACDYVLGYMAQETLQDIQRQKQERREVKTDRCSDVSTTKCDHDG